MRKTDRRTDAVQLLGPVRPVFLEPRRFPVVDVGLRQPGQVRFRWEVEGTVLRAFVVGGDDELQRTECACPVERQVVAAHVVQPPVVCHAQYCRRHESVVEDVEWARVVVAHPLVAGCVRIRFETQVFHRDVVAEATVDDLLDATLGLFEAGERYPGLPCHSERDRPQQLGVQVACEFDTQRNVDGTQRSCLLGSPQGALCARQWLPQHLPHRRPLLTVIEASNHLCEGADSRTASMSWCFGAFLPNRLKNPGFFITSVEL